MPTDRMRRVNEAVREVIGDAVGSLKDPRIGFVTVTSVDTSPDLRTARVYFSVLGDAEERSATQEGLESAHGFLQAQIGRELHLKRTPKLTFMFDETIERGVRISRMLDAE